MPVPVWQLFLIPGARMALCFVTRKYVFSVRVALECLGIALAMRTPLSLAFSIFGVGGFSSHASAF